MKPAYVLIMDYIKNKIFSRELKPGDKIPSENELAKIFNVSRLTARKSLENLEYEGIVTRIQGLGTFVASMQESLKGKRVGVLITNYQDTRASLLFGVVRTLQKFSISVIPFNLDTFVTTPFHEEKMLKELLKLEIKGLIMEPRITSLADTLLISLIKENFPVVFVDRTIEGFPQVPMVSSDNKAGGQLIGKHMKKHHVSKALFVTEEPFEVSSVKERFEGIKEEIEDVCYKMIGDYDRDFEIVAEIIEKENIEAVFFCNDYLAIRGITYLKEQKRNIPQDISIYGFDNLRVSVYSHPRLTTISQDFQAMGELAALQIAKIFLRENIELQQQVPVSIVVRESCGCKQ
ncbi:MULTISPECIES: GntR family transcriptional regulator [Pseudothermotoga]|jgi:DNA-binding LacI/PurR family transcriptional regulator|uniref:Regulatory protein GntR HTH n=1 Tax=Pseudothermotoga lettingae (strain ATCC BAA-301 / DSM 14385 / NBRC 107922 / TMO) TaxID=416591 RepID=A8F3E9_PSELT|nr:MULTISPECIES: GntR family transcriptional regulator [Pseudothermotoga]MDN5292125.1 GntR family transcriptional regulator, arabinose operon transcriptional repressor [Anaerophaga sp.]ABV32683.1 regulatory protein GntR HTH [Pseudothermotoga lettingae TMO]MDI3495789.1 GntR family transcriptional regulator, arabinose operon transcriptional repressor [Pseudothermotoga sp.]MDK2885293.1 GntR family transcriptional regulator, arabinose operon transcriptional repressor [Pseudothermotoga sp.]GLI48324